MVRPLWLLLLALAAAGCGESRRGGGVPIRPRDAGATLPDAGLDPFDAGVGGPDSTVSDRDSGTPPPDAGRPDSGGPPACPVTGPEDSPSACLDGCDNDQNGFADCGDFSCCAHRSDCAPGTACGDTPPMCIERRPENTLGRCTNGCDDDPDPGASFADCQDRSCCLVRQAGGMPCPSGTFCADRFTPRTQLCFGDDVTQEPAREATLSACSNACDDDRNGFDDCSDRNCCAIRVAGGSPCPFGTYCADMWTPGEAMLCPGDDITQPPATELDSISCSDGCDNDRNGFQDCNDRNCCAARTDCPLGTFCNP